jgi:hypothetical protein
MNKKLLSVVLSATCVIALAACGGSGVNDDTVLADADHATYCVVGPSQTTIGGEPIAWDYSEAGVMAASSRNDLKEVSEDLYDDLKSVKLSSLYILKDVVVGAEAAGYNKTAMLDGGLVQADGALTLKTASINYDAVDDVYSIDEWLVSPEHYGETLTPDTYWVSPHYETPDENGHSHASDPVVVAGAGTYTVVLARYTNIKEDGSKVGIGLVQQSANAEGQQVTPIVPVDLTSLGAIGSFAASEGWTVEAPLTQNEEDVWEGDVEAVAGNQFKIRANGAWTYSWGFAAVTDVAEGVIADVDGNISAVADGTYHISIVAPAQLSLISQDLTSFEITFTPAASSGYSLLAEYDFTQTSHDLTGVELTDPVAAKTLFDDAFVVGGTNQLDSVSNLAKFYDGNGTGGAYPNTAKLVKMGTGSVNGTVTLNFTAGTNIAKVVISCHDWYTVTEAYPTNTNNLVVNEEVQLAPYTAEPTPGELTYEFEAATDVLAISTSSTDPAKFGRVFLFSIAVYTLA